jgi:hypothetical protein
MEWVLLALLAVVSVLVAATAWRDGHLTAFVTRFRPEHDTVGAPLVGSGPAAAGQHHAARRDAAADVWPQALSPVAQARYSERWRRIQLRFVYEPAEAVKEADGLIDEVLRQLGYEPGDLGPGHAGVPATVTSDLLADYVARSFHRAGRPDTDVAGLREAFVRDRALFDQLVAATTAEPGSRGRQLR